MYRVIQYFTDLQDNGYAYRVGDKYPREGVSPSPVRIRELLSGCNRRRTKLIEEVDEKTLKDEDDSVATLEEALTEEPTEEPEEEKEKKPAKSKKKTKEV